MVTFCLLSCAIILILMNGSLSCSPYQQPVGILGLVNAASMSMAQRNQTVQLMREITSSLPDDSVVSINEISYTVTETASLKISSSDKSEIEKISFREVNGMKSNFIYSSSIDKEINDRFSVSQYKRTAEFVVLVVSDKTKLDQLSSLLKKKKTIVVVLGSSIPESFQNVASREDYLFHVTSEEDLDKVVGMIQRLIACDSDKYCDTDSYSLRKGSRCKSCEEPCSQNTSICIKRCLFMQSGLVDDGADKVRETTTNNDVQVQIEDNKGLVLGYIIGAIFLAILAIIGIVVLVYRKRKILVKILTPGNSEETIPKMYDHVDVSINEKSAVQVSDITEDDKLLEDQNASSGAGAGIDEVSGQNQEIEISFKNDPEFDLNVLSNKDDFKDLRSCDGRTNVSDDVNSDSRV